MNTTLKAKEYLKAGQAVRVYPLKYECDRTALGVIEEVIVASNGDVLVRSTLATEGGAPENWDVIYAECLDKYKDWPLDLVSIATAARADGKKELLEWVEP